MSKASKRRALVAAAVPIGVALSGSAMPLFAQDPLTTTALAVGVSKSEDRPAAPSEIELGALRLREGTRLRDAAGRFRQNGDTLLFIDQQNREITGLPNLNLERVSRMLRTVEEPESIIWNVSGTITEFGGRNFLLISRAVYKSATPPPAPEIVASPQVLAAPADVLAAEKSRPAVPSATAKPAASEQEN